MRDPAGASLTVLTQNIWGGVPGWQRRKRLLARQIARHAPDVIGLQEVHAPPPALGGSQAEELATLLGGYHTYFTPARRKLSGASEGVALLCKGTMREHAVHALTLDTADRFDRSNQRVVLCATIDVGPTSVDVFVTHLSLSPRARARTVRELLAFAEQERRRSGSAAAVLLGDFNAHSSEECIAEIERASGHGRPWCDAWKTVRGEGVRGGTWPAILPLRRLDYVFVEPSRRWTVARCNRLPFAGSDHLGVLARLHLL
jgi:endonuclease/exonuclease/phosphatase family metal-dependent hydrolase